MATIQKTIKFDTEVNNMLDTLQLWEDCDNATDTVNSAIKNWYEESGLEEAQKEYLRGFSKVIEMTTEPENVETYIKAYDMLQLTLNFLATQFKSDVIHQMKDISDYIILKQSGIQECEKTAEENFDPILKNGVLSVAMMLQQKNIVGSKEEAFTVINNICEKSECSNSHIAFTILQNQYGI